MSDEGDGFVKWDKGKPDLALWPPQAFLAVGRVLTYGAAKYTPGNWRKVKERRRYWSAGLRHVFAGLMGERLDPESGQPPSGARHLLLRVPARIG